MRVFTTSIPGLLAAQLLLAGSAFAQNWSQVPTPNPGPDLNYLRGISAVSSNEVWAVGRYQVNNFGINPSVSANLIIRWDSTGWTTYPFANLGLASTVINDIEAISSNNIWAVGTCEPGGGGKAQLLHWDGSSWTGQIVHFPLPGSPWSGSTNFEAIDAISANDIWAVGSKAEPNVRPALAYHYNGTSWDTVSVPPLGLYNDLLDVDGISANDVWAVGHYRLTHFGGQFKSMAMHWDGTAWTHVPLPARYDTIISELSQVKMVASNDVWAICGVLTGGAFMLHWDGTSWTDMPLVGGGGDLAVLAPNDIYSVGNNIAHWDGSSWTVVDSLAGFADASLIAAAVLPSGEIWAAGVSRDLGMNPDYHTLVYRRSGALPPLSVMASSPMVPAGTSVQLMAQPGGTGTYTYEWTAQAANTFSNPSIANPTVTPMVPTSYAVNVTDQNGYSVQGVVRVGIGVITSVTSAQEASQVTASPNPFREELRLTIQAGKAGQARVTLTDMLGREVYSRQAVLPAGPYQLRLDNTASSLPQGYYLLRLQTSDGLWQAKLLKE